MNVLFLGTPEFAVHSLESVISNGYHVVAVVTIPDKPAGRGQKIKFSPVKIAAQKYSVPVLQPANLKDVDFLEFCKSLKPDIAVVVAFRKLPKELYSLPVYGTFNLHASLLPQYRGAAPINHAIINGERQTGVTTFFINDSIDTGNIIFSDTQDIEEADTAGTLHDKLAVKGAGLVCKTLDKIQKNTYSTLEQEKLISSIIASELKTAPKIFKEHCQIDWNESQEKVYNIIRGLSPSPSAFSILQYDDGTEENMKIYFAEKYTNTGVLLKPGEVHIENFDIFVGTRDNALILKEIQPANKKRMSVREYLNGLHFARPQRFISR